MEELLRYRRETIPELRRIISDLPNHGGITEANNALEVAIDDYIDHIAVNNSPIIPQHEDSNGNNDGNQSFLALEPEYNAEIAAWGGRRRRSTKRSKRGKRRSSRSRR
jgi:hypothetical protein